MNMRFLDFPTDSISLRGKKLMSLAAYQRITMKKS